MKPARELSTASMPFLLTFCDKQTERKFIADHAVKARTHDFQAAAIYFAMVASGSVLYLVVTAAGIKTTAVDNCTSLIVFSWLGPAAHLALLWMLPSTVYQQHRTAIILGFRLFYLLATTINGFGVCGVGPINRCLPTFKSPTAEVQMESPMSAMIWRSGIIGLIWYAAAFPLLFWQHALVQTGFLLIYWRNLSPLVCSSITRVQYGTEIIASIRSAVQLLGSQLIAASGAPALATQAAQRALLIKAGAATTTSSSSFGRCLEGLGMLQVIAGHALPTLVIYCTEVRARQRWLDLQRQRQHALLHRSGSGGSYSYASSNGSSSSLQDSSSSTSNLVGATAAPGHTGHAAAAVAAADGTGAVQQRCTAPSGPEESESHVSVLAGSDASQQRQLKQPGSSQEAAAAVVMPGQQGRLTPGAGSGSAAAGSAAATAGCVLHRTGSGSLLAAATAAAAKVLQRTSSLCTSNSDANNSNHRTVEQQQQQQLLLNFPPIDDFDVESRAAYLPPSFPELYAFALGIGLAWFAVQQLS